MLKRYNKRLILFHKFKLADQHNKVDHLKNINKTNSQKFHEHNSFQQEETDFPNRWWGQY